MSRQLLQQALVHLQAGAGGKAAQCALELLSSDPGNTQAMAIAGAALGQCGEYRQARYWLQQLLQRQPDDLHTLINLAQVHRHLDEPHAAVDCLQRVLHQQPHNERARFQLASALQQAGLPDPATKQLRQLLQTNPEHVDALALQADLDHAKGRSDQAMQGYQQALSLQSDHVVASLGLAALELHSDAAAAAHDRLTSLLQRDDLSQHNRAIATHRLGMAEQAQGHYQQAFAAFSRTNQLLQALHPAHAASSAAISEQAASVYAPDFICRLLRDVEALPVGDAAQTKPSAVAGENAAQNEDRQRRPVFLLGFPRSGTTLLEQMLITHPQLDSIEENDNLADLHDLLLQAEHPLQTVMSLPVEQLAHYRRAYWQRLDALYTDSTASDDTMQETPVLIDKLPLNSVLLPVIAVLFPNAKILFALRDPRAVVFSCWQQMFAINEAMVQFLSLDSSVDYYALVMQLATTSLQRLPIDHMLVRHETLLQNPRQTLQQVLNFLDLPWSEAVLDQDRRGANRFIDTPSAQQIRRPMNRSGMQRWRHYAAMLPTEFNRLDHWVTHWGYANHVLA